MKVLKKSLPVWIIVLIAIMLTTAVVANVLFTLNLPSTINVAVSGNIQVLAYDETTVITSFTFADCAIGQTVTSPPIYVKNIGNVETYIAWDIPDLPAGFSAVFKDENSIQIPQNDFSISVPVGGYFYPNEDYDMRFFITNNAAAPESYSFTIQFISADSPTG